MDDEPKRNSKDLIPSSNKSLLTNHSVVTRGLNLAGEMAQVVDLQMNGEVRCFYGHLRGVDSVSFSPTGRSILSAAYDGTARVWDGISARQLRHFEYSRRQAFFCAAFSLNEQYVAAGGIGSLLCLFDVASGSLLARLDGHTRALYNVAFSADSRRLISFAWDDQVGVWDLTGRNGPHFLHFSLNMDQTRFPVSGISSNGRYIAVGGGSNPISLWNLENGNEVCRIHGASGVNCLAVSADAARLIRDTDDLGIELWDIGATSPIWRIDLLSEVFHGIPNWYADGITGNMRRRRYVRAVAISDDGRVAIAGTSGEGEGALCVFDIPKRRLACTYPHPQGIKSLALSRDGRYAITGGEDTIVRLWQLPE